MTSANEKTLMEINLRLHRLCAVQAETIEGYVGMADNHVAMMALLLDSAKVLDELAKLGNGNQYGNAHGNTIALKQLNKIKQQLGIGCATTG